MFTITVKYLENIEEQAQVAHYTRTIPLWLRHVNYYSKLLFSTNSTRFSYKRRRQRQTVGQTRSSIQHYLLQQTSDRKYDATYYIALHQFRPTTESTVTLLKALRIL